MPQTLLEVVSRPSSEEARGVAVLLEVQSSSKRKFDNIGWSALSGPTTPSASFAQITQDLRPVQCDITRRITRLVPRINPCDKTYAGAISTIAGRRSVSFAEACSELRHAIPHSWNRSPAGASVLRRCPCACTPLSGKPFELNVTK